MYCVSRLSKSQQCVLLLFVLYCTVFKLVCYNVKEQSLANIALLVTSQTTVLAAANKSTCYAKTECPLSLYVSSTPCVAEAEEPGEFQAS